VECHWPYDQPLDDVRVALAQTGLPLLNINTSKGADDTFGLSAIPGRESAARRAIDEALSWAEKAGAQTVHVMAGISDDPQSMAVFEANLRYGAARAQMRDLTLLIEPINQHDVPGYALSSFDDAMALIGAVGAHNVRLMYDVYHAGRMGLDPVATLKRCQPVIRHVQIASVPDRGAPDHGDVDFDTIYAALEAHDYAGHIGAEYKPVGNTDDSLNWLAAQRAP
jgi:hydroxypyruvate isomerase